MAWLRACALLLIVSSALAQERQANSATNNNAFNIPSLQEGNEAVVSTVNQIFGALRIPLNVRNPFRRNASERDSGIGQTCRTTSECVARSPNSVCYDGRCLCNLGYHFVARVDQCVKDNVCPVCDNPVNTCLGGQDVYCNGSCFADYRVETADKAKKQIYSPNWPNDYSPETDKFVCVQANTGKRVHLDLLWLDLETGCGHSCDYIKVYDGCVANDSSNLLAFYTGDNAGNRQQVTSNCNKMMVHFHSDKDDGGVVGRAKRQVTDDKEAVAAEPAAEKAAEPVAEKATEPAVEKAAEPAVVKAAPAVVKAAPAVVKAAPAVVKAAPALAKAAATAQAAAPAPAKPAAAEPAVDKQGTDTSEKFLQIHPGAKADEDYSKDQRSGFMGYYREIDYDEKVCACANP